MEYKAHGNTKLKRARLLCVVAATLLGIMACVSSKESVQHGWSSENGLVISHDSFPGDCMLCHIEGDWLTLREDFVYDHGAETGYELSGAHAEAQCLRCHNDRGPVEHFAAQGCAGCHVDVHSGRLPTVCEDCHTETDWRPVGPVADHRRTRFPLTGVHASTPCWRCHDGAEVGEFLPLDIQCLSCHMDDLARATDPDHAGAGWTSGCDRCHVPTTWDGGGFNHSVFPLVGGHDISDCSVCHGSGVFDALSPECITCHTDDYLAASDPDHQALSFPTQCEHCHGVYTWEGAIFNHRGITSGCSTCHMDDYLATSDPDHVQAGFPDTCEACHRTSSWTPASFQHSFPLEGPHSSMACVDCHLAAPNYNSFSCTHCHAHRESQMDDVHDDVSGYVWDSNQCLACHPDGDD